MEQAIVIRQAQMEDVEEIWDILHANCRTWTLQQIHDHIGKMFVLTKGYKMLGVLCGDFHAELLNPGIKMVDWVETHPHYPEKMLKDVMIQGLLGIDQSMGGGQFVQKTVHRPFLPIWSS
jgi:hypothetical protein